MARQIQKKRQKEYDERRNQRVHEEQTREEQVGRGIFVGENLQSRTHMDKEGD